MKKIIGTGSYGLVAAGIDKRNGEQIAIKKVKNIFTDLIDAKRVLREIKLLSIHQPQPIPQPKNFFHYKKSVF